MRQGIADHGIPAQDEEDADERADDGNEDGYDKRHFA